LNVAENVYWPSTVGVLTNVAWPDPFRFEEPSRTPFRRKLTVPLVTAALLSDRFTWAVSVTGEFVSDGDGVTVSVVVVSTSLLCVKLRQ
jgi:hypothetical protein